jgi:hypothetical protein
MRLADFPSPFSKLQGEAKDKLLNRSVQHVVTSCSKFSSQTLKHGCFGTNLIVSKLAYQQLKSLLKILAVADKPQSGAGKSGKISLGPEWGIS